MKTKQIPLLVMLTAGAAASITMRVLRYRLITSLWVLLAVLILFYIAGCVLQKALDSFEAEIQAEKEAAEAREAEEAAGENEVSAEGEVIEKEMPQEESEAGDGSVSSGNQG